MARKHALDDIGSVKAVHTVGPHDAGLEVSNIKITVNASRGIDGSEVCLLVKGFRKLLNERISLVHLHALCLAVVIEVNVVQTVEFLTSALWLNGDKLLICNHICFLALLWCADKHLNHLLV